MIDVGDFSIDNWLVRASHADSVVAAEKRLKEGLNHSLFNVVLLQL